MRRLSDSERELLEQLYRETYKSMFNTAIRTLRNRSLAKDAMQEAMRIACERIDDLKASRNPHGWIINALRNVLGNFRKGLHVTNRFFVADNSVLEGHIDTKADQINPDLLYEGLVSEEDYYILRRIGIDGCTVKELADELSISSATARKRIQRARERFRKQYAQQIDVIEKDL